MTLVKTRLGVLALAALVGVVGGTSFGCSKKDDAKGEETASKSKKAKGEDESTDDGKASKKKTKKDDDDDKGAAKAEKSGKYVQGDVLQHVPKDCKFLRLYVDMHALQKNDAFAANADVLEEKLTSSMKDDDAEKGQKVMKALKNAGIDPTKDVHEIAMCGDAKDDFVLAIGGDFAGKDPLSAISKAIEAAGDDAPKTTKQDGVSMLVLKGKKHGDSYLGAVAPDVLVVADDKDAVVALKDEKDRAKEWNVADGRMAVFDYREKGELGFDLTLTSKDDSVVGKFVATFDGSTGTKMKASPKEFEKQFGLMAKQASTKLEKTPLAAIAPDLEATKIQVDGNTVTVTLSVPNDHLSKVIKETAVASPSDLKKAFK